jgi:adenylate cyclase class 2
MLEFILSVNSAYSCSKMAKLIAISRCGEQFMHYEVEQKHRVEDGWDVKLRLAGSGAEFSEPISQSDQYFAHPCRDFAKTDEALRIRTEGGKCSITYKGPKLDQKTKTRQELNLPLNDADGAQRFVELFGAIGFSPVAVVQKIRHPFRIPFAGRNIEGALDLVDRLGVFIELELVVDEAELDDAKRIIRELASKLDLGPSVRDSYLEMLLSYPRMRPSK